MGIPDSIIRQISERTDFLELVGEYTTLHRMGDRYRGLCPFHQEKTPSFYVQPDKQLFYCFGCGKGGNLFQFLMEVEHLSFPEAVHRLAEKAGIRIETEEQYVEKNSERNTLLQLLKRVSGSFHYILFHTPEGEKALRYLEKRGIERSPLEKFQIGYAPQDPFWLKGFLEKKHYSETFLRLSGLFTAKNPHRSFFAGRIMFPIFSPQGEVVGFGGRGLKEEGPKYLNSPESVVFKKGESLYGFFQSKEVIRKTRTAFLCEGYMDTLALHQAGVENAIAPLGTALTLSQTRLIKRFADRVVLFFDQDEAGFQATLKAAILCEQAELEVLAVDASAYPHKDPAEFLQKGEMSELQKIVKYPIPILEFLLHRYSKHKSTSQGYQLKLRELFPYIESMVSEVKRDSALAQVADFFNLDPSSVRKDYLRFKRPPPKEKPDVPEGQTPKRTPDLLLMSLALEGRETFRVIRSRVGLEELEDPPARELFILLEEMYRTEDWSIDWVLQKITDEKLKSFLLAKILTPELKVNQEKFIRDTVAYLKRRKLEQQRKQIVKEIERREKSGQDADLPLLLEKKMYLDSELEKLRVSENE